MTSRRRTTDCISCCARFRVSVSTVSLLNLL